jgi:AcrR family transcriptional regulator
MSDERLARVEQACIDLVSSGESITLDAVAARAGIGRATIYRHPELQAIVTEHRRHGETALTLTGLAVELDQLRKGLEAVAAKVRRHEEQLRRITRPPDKRTG